MEKLRVAITDDEALFRRGIRMILESNQMIVEIEAADGEDLIIALKKASVLPDVILLDMKMERLNGVETTKIIRNQFQDIGIIILSSYFNSTFVKFMTDLGVNAYLPKNTEPDEVVTTIRRVHEKGFYFSEEMLKLVRDNINNDQEKKPFFTAIEKISDREKEVLELICKQYTSSEIADCLRLSPRTVEGHRKSLIHKTGVRNVAGLVVYALSNDIVNINEYQINQKLINN